MRHLQVEFIGRSALLELQKVPAATQLVFLQIPDTNIDPEVRLQQ